MQLTDANGQVTFQSVFPAAYSGRWPHAHFEIYPSLDAATNASSRLRTTQLALPEDTCSLVYATPGYEQSVDNMAQTRCRPIWSSAMATVCSRQGLRRRLDWLTATLDVPV